MSHQRRIVATATAVSWSSPTLTQPASAPRPSTPRDRLGDLGIGEIMHLHPHRVALGCPSRPLLARLPTTSFLVVSTLITGWPAPMGRGLLVDIADLAIPVGVLGALDLLAGGLQRVAHVNQQLRHGAGADRVPLPGQLVGQLAGRLAGPPQRRHRVTRAVGSTSASKAASSPGWRWVALGRPAPGRRTRPVSSGPWSISVVPMRTVDRLRPDARATVVTPPRPSALACAPASRRRCRWSRCGDSTANIAASASSVTSTPGH
jgi:hypothetical protein